MTISSTVKKKTYTGDGVTTAFPTTFPFFDDTEIVVTELVIATGVETVKTLTTHYTVSGGAGLTGTVTAVSPPASTVKWTLSRATARTQETDYTANDPFPAETHERALDRLTLSIQEVEEKADRSVKVPISSALTSLEMPTPVAGRGIKWNATADALVETDGDPDEAQTDSAASAAAAAASASAASGSASAASASASAAATAETNAETAETAAEAAQAAAEAAAASIGQATETAAGSVELATSAEVATGTDTERAITPAGALANLIAQGVHTIFIPAAAMTPTVSNGCASLAKTETTAGRPDMKTLDFDDAADEHAQFEVAFPASWNEGTITFRVFWTTTATDTDGVAWGLQGVSCSDGDTIDAAYGTAVVVTDAGQSTAEDCYVTAVSGAVTIAGTPAAGDLTFFRIFRDVSDAADTATEDARLLGVQLFYTVAARNDA